MVTEAKCLRDLELENARLKKLLDQAELASRNLFNIRKFIDISTRNRELIVLEVRRGQCVPAIGLAKGLLHD